MPWIGSRRKHRAVILLRHLEERLTFGEIGQRLEISGGGGEETLGPRPSSGCARSWKGPMSVDESGSIDGRRLAHLLAFEEALAGGDVPDIGDGLDPGESLASLRECVRLLEETLPAKLGGSWEDPIESGPASERIGRFTILGELGRGGFGVVLRAFDPSLKRQVALKVPRPEFLAHPDAKRRFLREGWASSRLEHPNIVSVLEAGEAGPIGYIASALCEGPSLSAWLSARSAPVPPRMAARVVAALAAAIEHAHGRDVLHRDPEAGQHPAPGGGNRRSSRRLSGCPAVHPPPLRFRPGQAARPGGRRDPDRGRARLAPLHLAPEQADGEARADRPRGRYPEKPGGDPLRVDRRPSTVPRRDEPGHPPPGVAGRSSAPAARCAPVLARDLEDDQRH